MGLDNKTKSRAALAGAAILAVMLVLAGRLYYIQIIASDEIIENARGQFLTRIKEPPPRGDIICMRNGYPVLLAASIYMPTLLANPRAVEDRQDVAGKLATILGRDADEMFRLLNRTTFVDAAGRVRPNYYVRIAGALSRYQAEQIRGLGCSALRLVDHPVRVYPRAKFLSTVLGFTGRDEDGFQNRGLEGLERYFDEDLRGERGEKIYIADARRKKISLLKEQSNPAKKGATIVLTINPDIQEFTEAALAEAFEKWRPESATAIVMDPGTGDILAMANLPDFDPNHYNAYSAEMRRNRAVTDTFEPGSTIKPFIASAVLSENLATPESSFKCFGSVEGRGIGDHCSGWLTLRDVIVKSSNIGAARMALMLNRRDMLQPWILRCGFGRRTGIDFPGERRGCVPSSRRCSRITAGSVGFGHAVTVTPLQIVRAYCAIANDGKLVRPGLVRAIIGRDGIRRDVERGETVEIMSGEIARLMRGILQDVVERGTGEKARIPGYSIGGKTGTAEIVVNGVYSHSRHISTFVGIGPIENPRLVVLLTVNDPRGGKFGGTVAAPGVGEILRRSLRLLDAENTPTTIPDRTLNQ